MGFDDLEIVEDGEYHLPDPHVLALARQLADEYRAALRRLTGRRVSANRKPDLLAFYRAAQVCRAEQTTPAEFVARSLPAMIMSGTVWPRALLHGFAKGEDHQRWCSRMLHTYRSCLVLFNARSTLYDPRLVVGDMSIELTPLFRYAMATRYGVVDRLAEETRKAARVERMQLGSLADETFGELIKDLT